MLTAELEYPFLSMNLSEIVPFSLELDRVLIASSVLWSLAFYLGLSNSKNWITTQLERWFNFAERSLYFSQEEFEKTRKVREDTNALYASILSIIPFLFLGFTVNWLVSLTLEGSWSISLAILACMICGIYELGRLDSE